MLCDLHVHVCIVAMIHSWLFPLLLDRFFNLFHKYVSSYRVFPDLLCVGCMSSCVFILFSVMFTVCDVSFML